MKRWSRIALWTYVAAMHVVLGVAAVAWATGLVARPLDTRHISIRTVRSEDVAERTGVDWGPGRKAHVVRYKGRKVLIINESSDSLDEIKVSPPGSRRVWTFSNVPAAVTGLASDLAIAITTTSSDTPLGPDYGELQLIMLDSDADGMPDLKKAGGEPGSASLRLRRDAWVPKDHPDAMPDREPAPR